MTAEYTCTRTKEQSKSIRQWTMGQPVTTKCIVFAIGTTEHVNAQCNVTEKYQQDIGDSDLTIQQTV